MSAIGELIVVIIYVFLAVVALLCLLKIITSKGKMNKLLYLIVFGISTALFTMYLTFRSNNHRTSELNYVGTYSLTRYPNCNACKLLLKENNLYEVIKGTKVMETGEWHFESGGDYWIVYMNDKNDQLGNERFTYSGYTNTYKAGKGKRTN